MKRFLIIFAICFASVIGVIGGVFGIKYLKGDFNEQIINPENIAFELSEYDVTDDFSITITTITEGVTKDNVTLSFARGTTTNTYGPNHLTDGVIIIPKQVKINVPFAVQLYKTADAELNGEEWIKGGISNIVAQSECNTTENATATINVDVPVYKTELVVLSGDKQITSTNSMADILAYIEDTTLATTQIESLNAGDTFYVGLKYYPKRSAYKYSKISSSNMLIEYYDEIVAKMQELGLDTTKINSIVNLFNSGSETTMVNINELINTYSSLIDITSETSTTAQTQFKNYLEDLNEEFNKHLKYYALEETAVNELTYTTKIGKIAGTSLYKMQATTDSTSFASSVQVSFYSYTFFNSLIENQTLAASGTDYASLLVTLENLYSEQGTNLANKKIDKSTLSFNIIDVDVDTIALNGSISDFNTNQIHTVYASKDGTSDANNSYLKIKLSNSNIASVDLQNKVLNVGIRFEKRISTNSWSDAPEINFVNSENYKTITYNGYKYYLPIGTTQNYNNAYWQIYSNAYITNDIRAVFCYFKAPNFEASLENTIAVPDTLIAKLKDAAANEELISWTTNQNLALGVINMIGVVDTTAIDVESTAPETTTTVLYNKEVDLSTLINIPSTNNFRTYKFFLYSDEEGEGDKISSYFNTIGSDSKAYTFNGLTKNLYELDGNILKLKTKTAPSYAVKVIFATIKTDALRQPILNEADDTYQFVKFSATKESLIENLFALNLEFTNSIYQITGTVGNLNTEVAGEAQDGNFKIAQSSTNVFEVSVTCEDEIKLANAIREGNLRIEARQNKNNAQTYISYLTKQDGNNYRFVVSTKNVDSDTQIRLYFVYAVDNKEYLFPIEITYESKTFYTATILKETGGSATFAFVSAADNSLVLTSDIEYITVTTTYDYATGFSKKYEATLTDKSVKEILITEDGTYQLSVIAKDFLGREDGSIAWYLKSEAPNVIGADEQVINFIGSCTTLSPAYVALYLPGDVLQEKVAFVVNEIGYVNRVVKYNNQTVYNNADDSYTYNFPKQNISILINPNSPQTLTNLLEIYYKMNSSSGGTSDEVNLPFKVYIANADTLDILKIIANGKGEFEGFYDPASAVVGTKSYKNTPISQIEISKELGVVVSLDFVYVCSELGISQTVTLKLTQTVGISNVIVKNFADEELISSTSTYAIYSGIPYTISIEPDKAIDLYYYDEADFVGVDTITATKITTFDATTGNPYITLQYADNIQAIRKIHITNSQTPTKGDLDYALEFRVQSNLKINTNKPQTLTLTGNTAKVYLTDLLERTSSSLQTHELYTGGATLSVNVVKDGDTVIVQPISILEDATITNGEKRYLELQFNTFTDIYAIALQIVCGEIVLGGTLSFDIIPENLIDNSSDYANRITLYKGNKAVVVCDDEIISSDNDANNIFTLMFESLSEDGSTIGVEYDRVNFNNTYTVKTDAERKVITSSNSLFTETGCYVTVTNNDIITKYQIIISKLVFPFINFIENDGVSIASYENLDIYNLFISTDNLFNSYNNYATLGYLTYFKTTFDNIAGSITEGKEVLKLVDTTYPAQNVYKLSSNVTSIQSDIINKVNFSDYGRLELIEPENYTGNIKDASSVAELIVETSGENGIITLAVDPIGEDRYIKVILKIKQSTSDVNFDVPVIVKLEQTQKLQITYPFSTQEGSDYGYVVDINNAEYGSETFDTFMTQTLSTFSKRDMEYLSFDISDSAKVDLLDSNYTRFKVYERKGVNFEFNTNYDDGYVLEIDKVSINKDGTWFMAENVAYYANITSGLLAIEKKDANIVRVKVKITTSGGAVSYYYVSAGETSKLNLQREDKRAATSTVLTVGTVENIELKSSQIILIGTGDYMVSSLGSYDSENLVYYYYLTNYNSELKYRVFNSSKELLSDDNNFVKCDSNLIEVKLQPLATNFIIEVYTMYGIVTTINVNVVAAYDFSLKETVYTSTEYAINDLIRITDTTKTPTDDVDILSVADVETTYYKVASNKIIFASLANEGSTTITLTLTVTTAEATFNIIISDVKLNARYTSNYATKNSAYIYSGAESDPANDTTYTLEEGNITLKTSLWRNLFKDNKNNSGFDGASDINLVYKINGTQVTNITSDITWSIGGQISITYHSLKFEICSENGETISAAYAYLTVKPQYNVQLTYPEVINNGTITMLDFEYVVKGESIVLTEKVFSATTDKPRVYVTNSADGTEYTGYIIKVNGFATEDVIIDGNKIDFPFVNTSYFNNTNEVVVTIEILINDITYANYKVRVIEQSPFAYEPLFGAIYVGYEGALDDILGYVDVQFTIPYISGLESGTAIGIYAASSAGQEGPIVYDINSNPIYYKAGQILRGVISLDEYNDNLQLFVMTDASGMPNGNDIACTSVNFDKRGTLKYADYEVKYSDYSKVLNGTDISDVKIEKASSITIPSKEITLKTGGAIGVLNDFKYAFDIQINEDLLSSIVLNANEQEKGLSFVNTFDIKDLLGNSFWYNHVIGSKQISLRITNNVGAINCLPIDRNVFTSNGIELVYDYTLRPVGATNDGTTVTIKFVYTSGDNSFEQDFTVLVKSDIEYEIKNNDGSTTSNSITNPLKVTNASSDILLSSETFTDYIYAYSKYATEPRPNIASRFNIVVTGDTNYLTVSKTENSELMLNFVKDAYFGNKKIVLTLTDAYGFTFNYYIELVAETDITAYKLDSLKIFEGSAIRVYNANQVDAATGKKGISMTLKDGNDIDTQTRLKITAVEFYSTDGKTRYSDSVLLSTHTIFDEIQFKFLNLWDSEISNGQSIFGELRITVVGCDASGNVTAAMLNETYTFTVTLTIYKKYTTTIAADSENLYVRDGETIDLINYVDVYDHEQQKSLGKPTLTKVAEVAGELILNNTSNNALKTTDGAYLYNYISNALSPLNSAIGAGIDRESNEYLALKSTCDDTLREYGITFQRDLSGSETEFTHAHLSISLVVRAVHKTNGSSIDRMGYYAIEDDTSTVTTGDYKITVRIQVSDEEMFGANVTPDNYYFQLYYYNMSTGSQLSGNYAYLATTNSKDVITITSGTNEYARLSLRTSHVYHFEITTSTNCTGISVAIKVKNVLQADGSYKDEIKIISQYESIDELGLPSTEAITGQCEFNLYNGTYGTLEQFTFEGYELELLTGIYPTQADIDAGIATGPSVKYFNGLSVADTYSAKNIKQDSSTMADKVFSLSSEQGFTTTNTPIYQTSRVSGIRIDYLEYAEYLLNPAYSANKIYEHAQDLNQSFDMKVTLRYTGINTSKAYIGANMYYHYTEGFDFEDDGETIAQPKTIELSDWSQNFKLIAGAGTSAIWAQTENLSLTNYEAPGNIRITYTTGTTYAENTTITGAFSIDETSGDITLYEGFMPNTYYVSIIVNCTYGDKNIPMPIATLYMAFVNVMPVAMYKQADNRIMLDINGLVAIDGEVNVNDITLGLAVPESVDGTKVTFDNSNGAIVNNMMYLLQYKGASQYISVTIYELIATNIIIYKHAINDYRIYLSDISLKIGSGAAQTLFAMNYSGELVVKEISASATAQTGGVEGGAYFKFKDLSAYESQTQVIIELENADDLTGAATKVAVTISTKRLNASLTKAAANKLTFEDSVKLLDGIDAAITETALIDYLQSATIKYVDPATGTQYDVTYGSSLEDGGNTVYHLEFPIEVTLSANWITLIVDDEAIKVSII
ncbi:MAG: hypothetical protein E7376_01235 [Clostridiales bacterium]|nr:hypothetical protein [Clostridiales bacterium]